ncbi:cell envelope integrity protein TolA [Methylibium sp.]|uniref:cell envelope integrity protein TolA n=1 Tax=Methylibium sp. TaxID=2067992 RepID=UPI003D110412
MNATLLDDLRPRPPGGLSRAALLALIAHGLLVLALSLGVSWRTSEPAGVEAELWAAVPQIAAPKAVPPEPTPTPAKPEPQAKVEPPPPPPNRDADIAREKREQKQKLEKQRLEDERKEDALRKKKEHDQQEQAKAEADKREADKKKKAEAERQAKQEAVRRQQLDRVMAEAAGTGAPGSTGTAAQSAGPSASYAGRIKARIKPNVVFADDIEGNPLASVEIQVAPDGTIVGRRLVKSSGVPAWDEAALRAIDKTEILPRDTDGRVHSPMTIDFRPRDF